MNARTALIQTFDFVLYDRYIAEATCNKFVTRNDRRCETAAV
jgi:hypothetical protein